MSATYKDLKEIVRSYLQQSFNFNEAFPGNVTVEDRAVVIDNCILRACNNARKWVEKKNNWVRNEVIADITIPAGEWFELTELEDVMTGDTFDMNVLTEVYYIPEGSDPGCQTEPLELVHYRTLSKMQHQMRLKRIHIAVWNNKISVVPALTKDVNLRLFGYRWMNDYLEYVAPVTADPEADPPVAAVDEVNSTDWMMQVGFDVLQWAAICEVNHLIQVYVPRQEGSLPPPVDSRDSSLLTLMDWDSDLKDAQFNSNA